MSDKTEAFVVLFVTVVRVPLVLLLQLVVFFVTYQVLVSSKVALASSTQLENAYLPILSTLLGIVILLSLVQVLNA